MSRPDWIILAAAFIAASILLAVAHHLIRAADKREKRDPGGRVDSIKITPLLMVAGVLIGLCLPVVLPWTGVRL